MSEMQESVTRSMTREYIEQGEPSTGGEWHAVSLSDLIKAGWESIAFHYPDDQETPNAVELHGEAPDTAPKSSDNCAASAGGRCVNRSDGHQRCDEDECVVPADPGATVTGSKPGGEV